MITDFKALTIPEGEVVKIEDSLGRVLWTKPSAVTFDNNFALPRSGGDLVALTGYCVSSYIPTNGALRITIRWASAPADFSTISAMNEYLEGYVYRDYWAFRTEAMRTVNLTGGANSKFIRVCFPIDSLDDCYVKDETNDVYLWKGANVS